MPDRVVTEEINLLAKVTSLLSELPEAKTASEAPIVRELERLREVILSGDEAKDISALTEQYHHQASVLNQLRSAGPSEGVDGASPYFAHLRLKENGKSRDLCLGRTTCIERGIRIVDWRDAPISKIFYSYRQGEQYDEEIAKHLRRERARNEDRGRGDDAVRRGQRGGQDPPLLDAAVPRARDV